MTKGHATNRLMDFLITKTLWKKWKWKWLSCVWLFVTPWTITVHGILQARVLEWVVLPTPGSGKYFPFPGDLPDPGIEPGSPALQADSLPAGL